MLEDLTDFIRQSLAADFPGFPVFVGELPTVAPSLAVQIAGGGTREQYHDTRRLMLARFALFSRHRRQADAMGMLERAGKTLARKKAWLCDSGGGQVASIAQTTAPQWVGQDERGGYLYTSTLEAVYYERD